MASASPSRTPCWHCRHMVSVDARSSIVTCGLDHGGPTMSRSRGGQGCQQWEREPGIDDDDWDPPGTPRIGAYVPQPASTLRGHSRGVDGWWTEPRRAPHTAPPPTPPANLPATRDPFGGMFNWNDDG